MEVVAVVGAVAGVAVEEAVVVAEADAEGLCPVEGNAAAHKHVEGLVVGVLVEVAVAAGADAENLDVTLALRHDAVADGGTGIEDNGEVGGQLEAVVQVDGHADIGFGERNLARAEDTGGFL